MTPEQDERLVRAAEEQARVLQVIAKALEDLVMLKANPKVIFDQGRGTVQPYEGHAKGCPICGKEMTRYGAMMVCHYCEDLRAKPQQSCPQCSGLGVLDRPDGAKVRCHVCGGSGV